jgi:hypothetical protein
MNKFESIAKPLTWSTTLLLAAILAGCGGGDGAPATGPAPLGLVCTGTGCVDLGAAASYVILSEAGITYTPVATVSSTPKITGNMGVSPAAATTIAGFALDLPAGGAYSTSTLVSGAVYAPGYAPPTPANLTTAVNDKLTAYNAAAGMAPAGGGLTTACPGVGNLGGLTIVPGVYNCANAVTIPANVTLSGAGVYVFQFAQTLTQAVSTQVILTNGALPENVFWQVAGAVSIGASAHMEGVILSASNIALVTNATVKGRLYSATSVAMDSNTVTQP